MLIELRIENFAIIDQLELNLDSGLNIFTGETGAGKSIILDAIEVIMGGRIDSAMIRSGVDRASVEGTFQLSIHNQSEIEAILSKEDLMEEPGYVTLSRELRREGRNIARVNGHSVNVSLLRDIGAYLVDIHGQSEHLSLLDHHTHIYLLDRYAKNNHSLIEYRKIYDQLISVRSQLKRLRQNEQDAARKTDLLNYQIQEIENAKLVTGEDNDLKEERNRLSNAENLAKLSQECLALIDEGSPDTSSITELLGQASTSLSSLVRIDKTQSKLFEQAKDAAIILEDISHELQSYSDQLEFDPKRLEQIEIRLDLINNLQKKYGGSISNVNTFLENARIELDNITHASEKILELEIKEEHLLNQIAVSGKKLSEQRQEAGLHMGSSVEKELADLSMPGAKFLVEIKSIPNENGISIDNKEPIAFNEYGFDKVEFLIAPNPGEGYKPMVKIASGGETSRLMLALKNVLAEIDQIPTLIFDEIDQGIGGRIGLVVGEKLWKLSAYHQVMCVTHLPQLAAFGDQHFRVQKQLFEGRTTTGLIKLDITKRTSELAQMFGGDSDVNQEAAKEILEQAQEKKNTKTNP